MISNISSSSNPLNTISNISLPPSLRLQSYLVGNQSIMPESELYSTGDLPQYPPQSYTPPPPPPPQSNDSDPLKQEPDMKYAPNPEGNVDTDPEAQSPPPEKKNTSCWERCKEECVWALCCCGCCYCCGFGEEVLAAVLRGGFLTH